MRVEGFDPLELARVLEREYGILTRPGLHCAPLAHRTIGTFVEGLAEGTPQGTTRLSFGPFLEVPDVKYAADALAAVAAGVRVG